MIDTILIIMLMLMASLAFVCTVLLATRLVLGVVEPAAPPGKRGPDRRGNVKRPRPGISR